MPLYLHNGDLLVVSGALAAHEDCCCGHTCHECGDCCFSDESTVNLTKPTLTYTGPVQLTADSVDAYNAADTSAMPFTDAAAGYADWATHSEFESEGDTCRVLFSVSLECGTYFYTFLAWVLRWNTNTEAWDYEFSLADGSGYTSTTCCDFSDGTDYTFLQISGNSSGEINNNKCCRDAEDDCYPTDDDNCPDNDTCEELDL